MEGHSVISTDVLASYAADAAKDVPGVRGLAESRVPRHRGVRVNTDDGRVSVELHVAAEWGASLPELGGAVQARVVDYLRRMADVTPEAVDVVIAELGPAPPS